MSTIIISNNKLFIGKVDRLGIPMRYSHVLDTTYIRVFSVLFSCMYSIYRETPGIIYYVYAVPNQDHAGFTAENPRTK